VKPIRYCGMRLSAEAMAAIGMITADEYLFLTGDPLLRSAEEQAKKKARGAAQTERNNAWHAKKRAQIVGARQ
jgi:hypothetical protein